VFITNTNKTWVILPSSRQLAGQVNVIASRCPATKPESYHRQRALRKLISNGTLDQAGSRPLPGQPQSSLAVQSSSFRFVATHVYCGTAPGMFVATQWCHGPAPAERNVCSNARVPRARSSGAECSARLDPSRLYYKLAVPPGAGNRCLAIQDSIAIPVEGNEHSPIMT